jgi:hypothetical protein
MSKQRNINDLEITKIEIHSASGRYNLIPHVVELNIYENIFSSALTANISLSDSLNIPWKLPIVGQETIDIDIRLLGYPDKPEFSLKPPPFHVNSIPTRTFTKPKTSLYTLDMISEQYMSSIHSKISRSYFDKSISQIVDSIHYEYLSDGVKPLYIEPTEKLERIIIPTLSPLDAIKWLAKRADEKDGRGINYVFFETVDGSYFTSLNKLTKFKPLYTFIVRPRIDDPAKVGALSKNQININKFSNLKMFDRDELIKRGVYSSKLITHDIVTKTIEEHDYDGYLQWEEIYHNGIYPPVSDSEIEAKSASVKRISHAPPGDVDWPNDSKRMSGQVDGNIEFYPKHDNLYSQNYDDSYDNLVEYWRQRRKNHMGIFDGITLLLEVSGVSSLRVGHTVNVIIPSGDSTDGDKNSDNLEDKFLSGQYMVTAIQHIISQLDPKNPETSYDMRIEVTKDGVDAPVSDRKSRKG